MSAGPAEYYLGELGFVPTNFWRKVTSLNIYRFWKKVCNVVMWFYPLFLVYWMPLGKKTLLIDCSYWSQPTLEPFRRALMLCISTSTYSATGRIWCHWPIVSIDKCCSMYVCKYVLCMYYICMYYVCMHSEMSSTCGAAAIHTWNSMIHTCLQVATHT